MKRQLNCRDAVSKLSICKLNYSYRQNLIFQQASRAAAMLQQSWDTIQQEKDQFRCHYKELRDAHIFSLSGCFASFKKIKHSQLQRCTQYNRIIIEIAENTRWQFNYNMLFIQSLNDTVAERDGEICHRQEERFFFVKDTLRKSRMM